MLLAQTSLVTLDWIVIVVYFVITLGIGLAAIRKVKDTHSYFLGSHGFGKVLMIAQSFGIGTHAEQPVSLAGAAYRSGFAAIWFQWKNMFATPFYWMMAPIFRRCRRTTTAQIIEDRYGPWMAGLFTVFALTYFILNLGSMMKGAAKVIGVAGGSEYSTNQIIWAMTGTFVLYSFVGGLVASAWTNFFQCFLQFALSFMLIPLAWNLVGGMSGMKSAIDDPAFFSLQTPGDITVFLIFMLTLNGLIGIMAQPHILASAGTGKTENACRIGFCYGAFAKRLCTIGWALVGLVVAGLAATGKFTEAQMAELTADPEHAFGVACQRLLLPGLLGLLIASVLADNMSAASAFMVDSGALFTRGFYDRFVAPGKSDQHYLWVGRFSGFAVTGLSVLYALFFVKGVLYSFLLTETLSAYFGISLLGGIIWRRANRWGALASFVVALTVNFSWYALQGRRLDSFQPEAFGYALLSGIIALVVVSLLTPPEGGHAQNLFDRLDVPVDFEEEEARKMEAAKSAKAGTPIAESALPYATASTPGQGPEQAIAMDNPFVDRARAAAAERGEQLILPNLLRLRTAAAGQPIFKAYRNDITGFALAWGVVIGMILLAWLILNVL